MFSLLFLSKVTKKLKGKFLICAKRTKEKFDPTNVVLPMKFMSPGYTMVTLRSGILLYMSTLQSPIQAIE